jgi:type I restriction enzyme S subunit
LVPSLADVAEINPGIDRNQMRELDEVISFVPMTRVSEVTGAIESEEPRMLGDVLKGFTPFQNRDVLVAKITPCFENGKIAHAQIKSRFGFGSTEFHVVRPVATKLDDRYLFHFLRQPKIREAGERRMTGSAGQRRIPKAFLAELDIPLPPLPEQRRIAAILDKADALRAKRREAIAKLDHLLQSVFLDMFGDPVTNPKGWPTGVIGDMLDSVKYGTSEKASLEGDVPVLRMNNITSAGEMDLSDLKYINLEPKELEKCLVRPGDLLFNRTNSKELVGKTAVYDGPEPMAFAGYLVRGRVSAAHSPEYISAYLNSPWGKQKLRGMCKSIVGMANINAQEFAGIPITIPSRQSQLLFASFVDEMRRKQKTLRSQMLELERLFSALQTAAFTGQLG